MRINDKIFYAVAKEMNKFKEVPYYDGISTTDIIQKIKNVGKEPNNDERGGGGRQQYK